MGSRAWCLSIARSADAVTVAVSVSVLFAVSGSKVRPVTDAELVSVVPGAVSSGMATTTEITGRLAPTARVSVGVSRVQTRSAPDAAHDQPVPVADTQRDPGREGVGDPERAHRDVGSGVAHGDPPGGVGTGDERLDVRLVEHEVGGVDAGARGGGRAGVGTGGVAGCVGRVDAGAARTVDLRHRGAHARVGDDVGGGHRGVT